MGKRGNCLCVFIMKQIGFAGENGGGGGGGGGFPVFVF